MSDTPTATRTLDIRELLGELNREDGTPLYQQLGSLLRSRLSAGDWSGRQPLPSEAKISEMAAISHSTVRQALDMLVQEGLLVRERGRGTFVRPTNRTGATESGIVRHHRLALVMPWDGGSFFAAFFPGIEERAHQAGFRTMLVNNWNDAEVELERVREAVDHGVDGLIWMCAADGPKPTAVRYVRERVPAVVMLDRVPPAYRSDLSLVDADNRGGMVQVIRHLVERGARRIAFARSQRHFTSTRNRERGYRAALKSAGIEVRDDWVFGTRRIGLAGGKVLAKKILQSGQQFDAICCTSDAVAVGIIHALQEHGLRVPEDVAVTGFDDDPMSAAVKPALTTVHMDLQTIAAEATRLLFDQLQRKARGEVLTVSHVSVPVQLIVRESA